MNTPTKLTVSRLILSLVIIFILLFPWSMINVTIPQVLVSGVTVDIRYPIAGVLFIIASLTDFLDGYLARKNNQITNTGKMLDAIADKVLVNGVLILLAYNGFISVVVPVVIVTRDIAVDALRALSAKNKVIIKASKWGKVKTIFMMVGLSLMLFYNLPFEVYGIYVADILIYIATILSVVSGVMYFINCKDKIKLD